MDKIKIPEDRYICKYCYYCNCSEDAVGSAVCTYDIHDYIPDVNSNACSLFNYDDTFERT